MSDDNNMVYDQIIISQGVFNEFGAKKASLHGSIDIIDFDNNAPYSTMETGEIKDLVSDHRPIVANFAIDGPDDDGISTSVENTLPESLMLYSNYPNPFQSIQYDYILHPIQRPYFNENFQQPGPVDRYTG